MRDGSSRSNGEISGSLSTLRGYAMVLTRNAAAADSLVHQTLADALPSVGELDPGTDHRIWLLARARRTFRADPQRRAAADTAPPDAAGASEGEWPVQVSAIREAVQQLPSDQAEALMLVAGAGLTYLEAAQVCGCAVGTIKSRVSRARARLVRLLDREAEPGFVGLEHGHY